MALVSTPDVSTGDIEMYRANVTPTSPYVTGAIRKNGYLRTRKKVIQVASRSLLPQVRDAWVALDSTTRDAWAAAAAISGMKGWNLFTQDTCYRIKYGIDGLAEPSTYHQYKVGRIEIYAPADGVKLRQLHPPVYYVSKKYPGNTTQRYNAQVTETLALPLEVGCSYRANLTSVGDTPEARFYAVVLSSYQGRTIETEVGFNFTLESGWTSNTANLTEVVGVVRSYTLFIELVGVTGWLEWDNVRAVHSGTNYARDPKCTDVNNVLTKANYQIEKSWEEVILPAYTGFDSVYPDDE